MARKPTQEKFKTFENVFDEAALRVIFEIGSKGYFEELVSPVSIGKESNIFSARTKDGQYIAVKIYRINSCDFHKMYSYIRGDKRFQGLTNQKRKVIYAWAQREYRNLLLAREIGLNAPKPIAVTHNVLLMEFIGEGNLPAPRLQDVEPANMKKFATEVIKQMKLMYKNGLVHGDLSEFNILNFNNKPIIIDFSHSVSLNYPRIDELIKRDVYNVVHYFNKKGLKLDSNKIFNEITGSKDGAF